MAKQQSLPASTLVSPTRLFFYAQAFRFSSGRGRCFSPGFLALCRWHTEELRLKLFSRATAKWWRVWLERV